MQTFRVICKCKHALHQRIESIGCVDATSGTEHRFNEDEAIRLIEAGSARFLVRDDQGHEAAVEVEHREGRKCLVTKADHFKSDNLLFLPECEAKKVVVTPPYRPVVPARSHSVHSFAGKLS
jgi:hypothetical protein